jgi:hypothetical protein
MADDCYDSCGRDGAFRYLSHIQLRLPRQLAGHPPRRIRLLPLENDCLSIHRAFSPRRDYRLATVSLVYEPRVPESANNGREDRAHDEALGAGEGEAGRGGLGEEYGGEG